MKIRFLFLVFFLQVAYLSEVKSSGHLAASDYDIIMGNARQVEWSTISSASAMDQNVNSYMASMDTLTVGKVGSWSDIDYSSTLQQPWLPLYHLNRVKLMATAYTYCRSSYFGNDRLFTRISQSLDYWYIRDPRSTNWWYQQVASPQRIGIILILMRLGGQQLPSTLETNLLNRMTSIGGDPAVWTGANKLDIAIHWLYRACLTQNHSVLSTAVQQGYSTIAVATAEGLQCDNSYLQHGPQFYTGGYGLSFGLSGARIALDTKGSTYAMSKSMQNVFLDFMRDSYFPITRGLYLMYNSTGRGLSRPGALVSPNVNVPTQIPLAQMMRQLDVLHSSEYDTIIERLSGSKSADYGMKTRFMHYWRGDYTLYYSPAYNFDIRCSSNRTYRCESGNGENLKGYFLSDGGYGLFTRGDEYLDVFPVWDWARIPGTTAPHKTNVPKPTDWGTCGTSYFSGGLSNASVGVTVYQMNNNESGIATEANKSWFVFGNEIVCLGASINSAAVEEVNTTINQCLLRGDVIVHSNSTETLPTKGSSKLSISKVNWVYHDNVGYVFPKTANINLSTQTLTGNWNQINSPYDLVSTKDVFNLWLNHGVKPTNAGYSYILVPGKSLDEIRNYDVSNIQILQNSASIQAVQNKKTNLLGIVFYKPGTFIYKGLKITVSGSCILLLSNSDSGYVHGWIADPTQSKSELVLLYNSPKLTSQKKLILKLPAGSFAGSTSQFKIRLN